MTDLQKILTLWQNSIKFREDFKKNPQQTLEEAGFTVTPEDLEKIQAALKLDPSKNEQLDDRISK